MKINTPVTQNEKEMQTGSILVSKTDLKGIITYCNQDFIDISGFNSHELIGKNHNLVRHPDMPVEAFKDLWVTVKQGLPWSGIVKNRCKNGDYYWVKANVTPISGNGVATGYMSVRTRPTDAEIDGARRLYRALDAGTASLRPKGLAKLKTKIVNISVTKTIYAAIAGSLGMQMLVDAALSGGFNLKSLLATVAVGVVVTFLMGQLLKGLVTNPLENISKKLERMSEGVFFDWIETGRTDEIGQLENAVKTTQVKLGFDVMDSREITRKALRSQSALDNVDTSVMIADAEQQIIYTNAALVNMFNAIQVAMGQDVANFNVNNLIGSDMDVFSFEPNLSSQALARMVSTVSGDVRVGGCALRYTANPILDKQNQRIGTVIEWQDRTQQVAVEKEIANVVKEAGQGQLSERLSLQGKDEFQTMLAEQLNTLMNVNQQVVADTQRVFGALAAGDLSQTINVEYQGAFGQLKNSANKTVAKLNAVMGEISQTSGNVRQASEMISEGNQSLRNRTKIQASEIETTGASIEEISGIVRQNADNAREAHGLAQTTQKQAEQGGTAAERATKAMSEINIASRKITEITSVIDEIAFQTNLLALNASVEAAHAGDQGRGFAVVANEVRDLAQRSAEAAKQIKGLIEDSLKKVNDGSLLVDASAAALGEIIESVQKVNTVISEISMAGGEQTIGIEQINKAVLSIDQGTQHNVEMVDKTASASNSLNLESEKLAEMVAIFKINGNQATGVTSTIKDDAAERRSKSRPWVRSAA